MSLRQLPEAKSIKRPQNFQWDAPSDVLAKWSEQPLAADNQDANTITVFDVIGEDFWSGGGFTAKRMANALRSIGTNDIVVKINSPGGDMFEGIAIYNLLREHKAKVSVQVMGWAASAASIIAMAGDEISMGLGTFMMVHNAWGMVVGNRHDMRDAATLFDGFDSAIADIYQARTGLARADIEKLMDAETFMGPTDAVAKGFADKVDNDLVAEPASTKNAADNQILARRRTEAALAKAGIPRGERTSMINSLSGQRDATRPAPRDAGFDPLAVQRLIQTIKS
ncbi:peptidase [Mesorhizobium sp. SEMIA 3007]|uniref:ATP-dependent Clp protease proteolytic subunit n=1 Tax=Mesorhizobium japonicum (strain LMG 29417 / CECT 9101 / MAFF 303099) TaxID=266835 RepID=Q982R9_RHILO|nr:MULTISPECIES: head maturation protease, ClpP-related [Mesorhizobium]ODA94980.1 peptidase [Mesorhizobium sp. SEMIA 3007]BAB54387.1 mlr8523 [Mesorhizobium japonicum MAFF 303099]